METSNTEVKLAVIEKRLDHIVELLTEQKQLCEKTREGFYTRVNCLEKESVRTKTFFGVAGAILGAVSGGLVAGVVWLWKVASS